MTHCGSFPSHVGGNAASRWSGHFIRLAGESSSREFHTLFIKGGDRDDTWFQLPEQLNAHGRRDEITAASCERPGRISNNIVSGFPTPTHSRSPALRVREYCPPTPTSDPKIVRYFINNYLPENEVIG